MTAAATLLLAIAALAGLGLSAAALHAARCNYRRFRVLRLQAPFAHTAQFDSVGIANEPWLPAQWPATGELRVPGEAEAYARLAEDRSATLTLAGEALLLVAGGVLGALVPRLAELDPYDYAVLGPVFLALVAARMRYRAVKRFDPLVAYYRAHAQVLLTRRRPAPVRGLARPRPARPRPRVVRGVRIVRGSE